MNQQPKTTAQWVGKFLARFPKPYGFDPDAWESVFAEDLGRDWSDDEICQTLKWMQSDGQRWRTAATASVLVMAQRCRAKVLREAQDAPKAIGNDADCPLCNGTGMLPYWPDWRKDWTAESYGSHCIRDHVPCMCPEGRARWNAAEYAEMPPAALRAEKDKASRAVGQFRAWNAACGESIEVRPSAYGSEPEEFAIACEG